MTLPEGYFSGGSNLTTPEGLAALLDAKATVTTGELHVYADATGGDDSNDGLSAAYPKKTLEAVLDLVPDVIKHNTMVHLAGEFTLAEDLHKTVVTSSPLVVFVIAGQYGSWTDTGEGILTTTAGDASSLDVSGAGWTTDEHAGYYIEILTGDAAGEIKQVFSNDADTLVPAAHFLTDPRGSGEATFRIVKQPTLITGELFLTQLGSGRVIVQDLRFGTGSWCHRSGLGLVSFGAVMFEDQPLSNIWVSRMQVPSCIVYRYLDDFSPDTNRVGCAFMATGKTLNFYECSAPGFHASVFRCAVKFYDCASPVFGFGYRLMAGVEIHGAASTFIQHLRGTAAGYTTPQISNASGPGVLIRSGHVDIAAGVDISNCSTWGVEVADGGTVYFDGVVTGTGNTTGGCYAYNRSTVFTKSGSAPTLTGGATIELSFDGSTQQATWATVNTTPQIENTTDLLLARAK